jgi:hypothetical protein
LFRDRGIVKILFLLLPIYGLISGCTHLRFLTPDTPADTMRVINQRIAPFHGCVTKETGEYYYGKHIQIGDSLTLWKNSRSDRDFSLPNNRIHHIIALDRKLGFVEGLEYGAVTGAFIGASIAILWGSMQREPVYSALPFAADSVRYPGDRSYKPWKPVPMWQCVGVGALSGAVLGSSLGIFIGYSGGSQIKIRYVFPPQTKQKN